MDHSPLFLEPRRITRVSVCTRTMYVQVHVLSFCIFKALLLMYCPLSSSLIFVTFGVRIKINQVEISSTVFTFHLPCNRKYWLWELLRKFRKIGEIYGSLRRFYALLCTFENRAYKKSTNYTGNKARNDDKPALSFDNQL